MYVPYMYDEIRLVNERENLSYIESNAFELLQLDYEIFLDIKLCTFNKIISIILC